jgi:hypothetical protein
LTPSTRILSYHGVTNSSFARARIIGKDSRVDWTAVGTPPEPYDFVWLQFEDGSIRRGTWNGKMWWGYDERARRSCALHPIAWRAMN